MNELISPIENTQTIYCSEGFVTYQWKNIFFKVAKLSFELFRDESFQYIFEPYYDVIDAFEGLEIPGIDLTLRQIKYYRVNMTPVFISERIPPKNRVNLVDELKEYSLNYHQPFLLLLNSNKQYGGDKLSLKSEYFFSKIELEITDINDLYKLIPFTLKKLATRSDFMIGEIYVNERNRTLLIQNYCDLYEKVSNYYQLKTKKSLGRTKQNVPSLVLEENHRLYSLGVMTIEEAISQSGLKSKRTYYRRIKELKDKKKSDNLKIPK